MDLQTFGGFIAAVRKERGMTQAQLAQQLHVTDKAVSRWERGLGFPDIQTLEPLAGALDLSLVELIRSERLADGSLSSESADAALTEAMSLAEKQHSEARRQMLTGLSCALLGLITLLYTGVRALPAVFFFYSGIAGTLICHRQLHRSPDGTEQKIMRLGAALFALLALYCLFWLLPGLLAVHYGHLLNLAISGLMCINLLRSLLELAEHRDSCHRGRTTLLLVLSAAVLALCIFSIGRQLGRIGDEEEQQRYNVIEQHAELLAQRDLHLTEGQLLERQITEDPENGSIFDAVFKYRQTDGSTAVRLYRLELYPDGRISVLEPQ